jgi:hypothetical protein
MNKEYVIWGMKNGVEDIVRINGEEVQKSYSKAVEIKNILAQRGDFDSVRIQVINLDNFDLESEFSKIIR